MILRVLGRCGPYPRPGEACSGYLLSHEEVHLILDLGSGTVSRLRMLFPDLEPDAIVLSHLHFDHMSDLLVYQYLRQAQPDGAKRRIPLYLPAEPEQVRDLIYDSCFEKHLISDGMCVKIGNLTCKFMAVQHPVETFAVRISDPDGHVMAYTGDTGFFEGLEEIVQGADLLLADTAFRESEHRSGKLPHMTVRQAGALARRAHAKKLLCSHVSGNDSCPERGLEETDFPFAAFAEELREYTIN